MLLNKRKKNGLKFNPALWLISLWTTEPGVVTTVKREVKKLKKKNILISFPLSFSYNIIFSLVHVRKHCKPFKLKEFANEAQEIYIDVNKALIR